jgi:hypothetical protein
MLNGRRRFVATEMDSSALADINALPSCDAMSKTPRAAGYRGSDFVQWHIASLAIRQLPASCCRNIDARRPV